MKLATKTILSAFAVIIVIFLGSCTEKKTDDPIETYKLWSGEPPPENIKILNGKYWQSDHWSKEYIMYLELKASAQWRSQFTQQNNLVETKTSPILPSDAPAWFTPRRNLRILAPKGNGQGSAYYEDTVTGVMFIYETQL
jgi:hypothetical protein